MRMRMRHMQRFARVYMPFILLHYDLFVLATSALSQPCLQH